MHVEVQSIAYPEVPYCNLLFTHNFLFKPYLINTSPIGFLLDRWKNGNLDTVAHQRSFLKIREPVEVLRTVQYSLYQNI